MVLLVAVVSTEKVIVLYDGISGHLLLAPGVCVYCWRFQRSSMLAPDNNRRACGVQYALYGGI